jgi:hypothetical protein
MALPKIYDKTEHQWHNNTTPSINEDELNAISEGLSDIDDRVIDLAGTIMEDVPAIQEALEEAETLVSNPPYIGANGNWWVWDTSTGAYVDSGVDASITITVGTTTTLSPGSSATVTNVGTATDPIFNFGIPKGEPGSSGSGDMQASVYDPNDTVATAGGIVAYVADAISTAVTSALTASY